MLTPNKNTGVLEQPPRSSVTEYGVELSVSTSVTSSGVQIFKAIR